MKSPFAFIVKPVKGKRYDNTKNIGGIEFIVSTSQEEARFANRKAEVIELPLGYKGPIQVGDFLLVHHNVFKYYNDMQGMQRSGKSYFKDDLFFVEPEQFYMYHNGTQWNAVDRYCFVKPSSKEKSVIFNNDTYQPLTGTIEVTNDVLTELGVKKGDKVCFKPESEYEFKIDDQTLYRMKSKNITMTL